MAIKSYEENGKRLFEVYVNGADALGRRIQWRKRGLESQRKAASIEFELKRELAKLKEDAVPYRWEEWLEECLRRMRFELRPSTVACYETQVKKWINPHWAKKDLGSITKADVFNLIFTQCQGMATQYTRRNVLMMVKRVLQLAVEEGILERNPCTGVNVRVSEVAQEVLTNAEVELFLTEARRAHHRFYPVWVMALMTGMRSGELFALKWTDVDFDGRLISVSKAWNSKCGITPTKTRRARMVPISEELIGFLKEQKLASAPECEFVLPRLNEWESGEQARVTREFCSGIGITSVKFHDLRATFITNLLARGESLARVMSIVGHSELKTTNGYLRKAGVDVVGGTDRLGYRIPNGAEGKVLSLIGRTAEI